MFTWDQTSQYSSKDVGWTHEVPLLDEELLAIYGCSVSNSHVFSWIEAHDTADGPTPMQMQVSLNVLVSIKNNNRERQHMMLVGKSHIDDCSKFGFESLGMRIWFIHVMCILECLNIFFKNASREIALWLRVLPKDQNLVPNI